MIEHDVAWAENRDDIFMNRLADDIGKLQAAGYSDEQVKSMLGTFEYVKTWCSWPRWAFPVDKLPKGAKWKDAEKYHQKAEYYKCDAETWYFLSFGEDLYIRKNGEKIYIKIVNFRDLTACQLLQKMDFGPFFYSSVLKFWRDNALKTGFVIPKLRDLK